MIAIVETNAAFPQGADVVFITMLVEGDEEICFITCGENFPATDVNLEDRRPAGDGGRDRHVSHHILLRPACKASEEAADGLNAVLGVARHADDGVLNIGRETSFGGFCDGGGRGCAHGDWDRGF